MTLRILDANRNRAREGLRVLEDIARFQLDDAILSERLKHMRQEIAETLASLEGALLAARRAAEDVGAFLDNEAEGTRSDVLSVVAANAKRAEEALRTLEELAKLPEVRSSIDAQVFKQVRFRLYEVEAELHGRLLRQAQQARLRGLYAIIDPTQCHGRSPIEVAQAALEGGAAVVQWRDKTSEKGLQLPLAARLHELCRQTGALFVVNDHVDLAAAVGADGVHLGQDDLPIAAARRLLPLGTLVGVSTHSVEQARRAAADGADYVAIGAMFETATKESTVPAGVETLRWVKEAVNVPVVAIGGITPDNVGEVVAAGADMVAAISAICGAEDVVGATRALVTAFARD